ncbi:type I secretion system permease/ATPase [Atlantibacter hermannii]|uniref:type I secretion system permease/ATPase n=1 Tax=Atlantibacter hermannii TaxID=565 RepID=UPI0028A5EA03|nr:type I secretion system permease/ATPase [Atlantibacter hermannii]
MLSLWSEGLVIAARELGINVCKENLIHLIRQENDSDAVFKTMGKYLGLHCERCQLDIKLIPVELFPLCVPLKNGKMVVVHYIKGEDALVSFAGMSSAKVNIKMEDLSAQREGAFWIVQRNKSLYGRKLQKWLNVEKERWLWNLIRKDFKFYILITISALFGNILTLAGSLFSMQVYDRVIPAQSFSSLWVLFSGVIIALLFDMLLRMARSRLADSIGKRADINISALFYSRALSIKNSARPDSTGTFIAQIREIEHVRELLTSTTVLAIVDMPFIVIFMSIIWFIGGWLVLPAILAIPLIVLPGIVIQWPLSRLSSKGMAESAQRNALLVETVQGLEDIKLTQSEDHFLGMWNHCVNTASQVSMDQRHWSYLLSNWCQFVQQAVYACVIALGVYFVIDNTLTTGTLIACSILSSRAVGPLGQIASILTRWQHARISLKGLNEFLARPLEQRLYDEVSHLTNIRGNYKLADVKYRFSESASWAINVSKLDIKAGEKIAILGTIGAGKSTLLRILSGMADSAEGEITLDGVALNNLSVNDIRFGVAYLQQDAQLFCGTVRDNILLGNPHASAQEIAHCLNISGAGGVLKNERGLDLIINEGGKGLSGGQRQALLLARTLLRNSNILLLDEPTASMDESTEIHVVNGLHAYCKDKTLIVVTHRQAPLHLVDRIIVMDHGQIVMDGPKETVINKLQAKNGKAA